MPKELRSTPLGSAVRISIPAKVAYDLKAFQKSIADLVEDLGCRTCFSGVDCTFITERNFVVNPSGKVSPRLSNLIQVEGQDPDVDPILPRASNLVSAQVPVKVGYNLKLLNEVIATISDRLGCAACCSGFDISFRQELDFVINNEGRVL